MPLAEPILSQIYVDTRPRLVDSVNTQSCAKPLPIETVSPEGTFCDTVQVPSRGGDMELI